MSLSEIQISYEVKSYLRSNLSQWQDYLAANQALKQACGLVDFFKDQEEIIALNEHLTAPNVSVWEEDRVEYGDFQTNISLAKRITLQLVKDGISPQVIIEPTFGKGNFILAALHDFDEIEQILGIEIYKPYFWETKFSVLDYYLQHPNKKKPIIRLFHQDVFDFNFQQYKYEFSNKKILVLGNPPWVTNAKLGSLDSDNLPVKSNFKNLNGFDAITGKGNFDIGEYITLMLIRAFHENEGWMAFLVKNTVIKNIVFEQRNTGFHIGGMMQYLIDAKKEFGAAVDASLFFCQFNKIPGKQCIERNQGKIFGWVKDQFVSDVKKYVSYDKFDGVSPFEWRQGLKHDCSAVMELVRQNGCFINAMQDVIQLENDLVYGLLKSSDLKGGIVNDTKKFTIVTQKRIGQDTKYIKDAFPQTFRYLQANEEKFISRKSSIYKNKPAFSIFGVGDYSFLPYKVAISGLYKSPNFTLVLPQSGKPIMLDDTCYFIGFNLVKEALLAYALLSHDVTKGLLEAITFQDAKRIYTKDVLMRIDIGKIGETIPFSEVQIVLKEVGWQQQMPTEEEYHDFLSYSRGKNIQISQMQLF